MGAYKDKNGTWYAQFRFTNWKGEPDRKTKRGFATKREALDWERDFLTPTHSPCRPRRTNRCRPLSKWGSARWMCRISARRAGWRVARSGCIFRKAPGSPCRWFTCRIMRWQLIRWSCGGIWKRAGPWPLPPG